MHQMNYINKMKKIYSSIPMCNRRLPMNPGIVIENLKFSDMIVKDVPYRNPHNKSQFNHIDVRFNFVKNLLSQGEFNLSYVSGKTNVADVLTNPLIFLSLKNIVKIYFFRDFKN